MGELSGIFCHAADGAEDELLRTPRIICSDARATACGLPTNTAATFAGLAPVVYVRYRPNPDVRLDVRFVRINTSCLQTLL